MLFKDKPERVAIIRLAKLALDTPNYGEFEGLILRHTGWYLRTPTMRKWTKATLKRFYTLRNIVYKEGKFNDGQ